ncbi:MAG: NADH pyrophosphatase, partial [Chloroflexi bacterium]|nr:NADH pyrophosphatase [Chloroflexota bacterium]
IHFDSEEMTDVRWYSREDALAALNGNHPSLKVPGPIAIAHHLIKAWATGGAA